MVNINHILYLEPETKTSHTPDRMTKRDLSVKKLVLAYISKTLAYEVIH